jgi:NAD(P)-dependent dehydrogenase (short-subunit alcohol dehydrogenase family)
MRWETVLALTEHMKLYDLTGRVALVTGGAQGMGAAICRLLAEAGANVIVADIQTDKAESVATSIREQQLKADGVRIDVADEASILAVTSAIEHDHGRLDVLVNNAGTQDRAFIEDTTAAYWDRLMAINVRGPALLTREAVRIMRAGRIDGRIVNIASNSAFHAVAPSLYAYSTSKAAIAGLTRATAMEVAKDGIRVNAVCPGNTTTEGQMTATGPGFSDEQIARFAPPIGRAGRPGDIASAVLFFASDVSSYITGQTLVADGGWLTC